MSIPSSEVAAAVEAWTWVPAFARTVETDDHLVVRYPDTFDVPMAVARLRMPPRGDAEEALRLLDAALASARTLQHDWVSVRVPLGAPACLEAALERRGGTVLDTLDVLAADLAAGVEPVPVPADVAVRPVSETDLATATEADRIGAEVFGGSPSGADFVARETAGADLRRAEGVEWAGVAVVDGRVVGSAGTTLVDGVLRLWGGGVLPDARGRGAYRALLDARLAWGGEHRARMALVKGRVTTSGPILRRVGFTAYGTVRDWRVDL